MAAIASIRRQVQLCIGKAGLPVGSLVYVRQGRRSTPPLVELERVFQASRAVERGDETAEDLLYLQGKGTSLGGMRPKCTLVDEDGRLAIGKFPSVGDARSVSRGEVLALKLAAQAGIDAAPARVVLLGDLPVAIIRRFDRDEVDGRIPYQSGASLLQASREEDRTMVKYMRAQQAAPSAILQQPFQARARFTRAFREEIAMPDARHCRCLTTSLRPLFH